MNNKEGIKLKIDGILIAEQSSKRLPQYDPTAMNVDVNLAYAYNIFDDQKGSIGELTSTVRFISKDIEACIIESKHIAIVAFEDDSIDASNPEAREYLDVFMKLSCPAMLVPYMREHVNMIAAKSGFNNYIVPPINLAVLTGEVENKDIVEGKTE